MTIRAITEILQYAISKKCANILGGNTKRTLISICKQDFLSFDKVKSHSTIGAYRGILQSNISAKYVQYFRGNIEITLKFLM
jgi:hypothetical protein